MREKILSIFLVALGMTTTVCATSAPVKLNRATSSAAIHAPYQTAEKPGSDMKIPFVPSLTQPFSRAFAAPSNNESKVDAPNADVLLYQDFSMLTDGSEEELGTDLVPYYSEGDPYIPEEYIGEAGWYGFGLYSAGEKVALAYPGIGGVINTPEMNMYGRLIVTTRVKVREGNSGKVYFFVNCVKGDWINPVAVNRVPLGQEGGASQMYSQTVEDGWVDVTTVIYNPYQGDDCWIQVNAYDYCKTGIMIDEIKVERDYDFCMAPTNLMSYDFTDDGFTARWEPGANNASYLYSLLEERKVGDNVTRYESFDTIEITDDGNISDNSVPEGLEIWLGEGNQATADGGYEGSKALIIDSSDDVVMLPDNGNPIIGGSIYVKSNIEDEGSFANLYIIGISGSYSEIAGGIRLYDYNTAEGVLFDLNDFIANISSYTCLGFQVYYMEEGDEVILDQISWTTLAPTVTELVREDIPADSNIIQITGLDPQCDYSFSVKGVSESGLISDPSPFQLALGCPAPKVLPATEVDAAGSYVANWEPSVKANSYLVRNFENYTIEEDTDNYSVLWDAFLGANIQQDDMEYLWGESFDGIADMNGWTGTLGIYSYCSIGAIMGGDVVTPPLNLGHDDGKFKVRVVAQIVSGSGLNVQCNTTSFQTFIAPEPLFGDLTLDTYEFEFEFEDGTDMTNIMFYGTDYNGFLLDEVEITQNVKKGDKEIVFLSEQIIDGHDTDNAVVNNLNVSKDYDFAYTVSGIGNYRELIYLSSPSSIMEVNFNTVGINEVATGDIMIAVENGKVKIDLGEENAISVYSVDGTVVAHRDGIKGVNYLDIPAAGVYIVKVGSVVKKVRI